MMEGPKLPQSLKSHQNHNTADGSLSVGHEKTVAVRPKVPHSPKNLRNDDLGEGDGNSS